MYGISNALYLIPDLISDHPRMLCNVSPLRNKETHMFQYNLIFNNHIIQ